MGPEDVNGRQSFEKSTKDLFLFYHPLYRAWCISPELHGVSVVCAMAETEVRVVLGIACVSETVLHRTEVSGEVVY